MRIITFFILAMMCYHLNAQNESGTNDNENIQIDIPLKPQKKDRSINLILFEAYYHNTHIYISNNDNFNAIITIKEENSEEHLSSYIYKNSISIIDLVYCINKRYTIEIISDDGNIYIGELIL